MDLFWCVVLTTLFTEALGADFFISDSASDWTTATKQCQLAEPLTVASEGKVTDNIPVKINEDVWVGYYQARTAFEYFGCAKKPGGQPMFKTEQEDPGQCMSACGTKKRIGIFKKECFCYEHEIGNDSETMVQYCNKICKDINGIVCGGQYDNDKYISLYRSIGMDDIGIPLNGENDDQMNCMYYLKKTFMWSKCSLSYKTICGLGNKSWIEKKSNTESSFGIWTQSTIKCFENETRPSTYNNALSVQTNDSTPQLWTGIVRSQVVYKYTTDTSYLKHANMFGYLYKDGKKIKFALTDSHDAKKKSICVNVIDTTTTPSSTETHSSTETPSSSETPSSTEKPLSSVTPSSHETPSSSVKPSSSATPSSTETSTSMSSSTTAKTNDTNSTDQLRDEEGTSDVGAIVGATLSIVVVFAVVVVLFLRKRGFQLPFLKKEKQAPSQSMIQNNAISRPAENLQSTYLTDNEEYAQIDLTTTLDKIAKNGKQNDAPESSDIAHCYFVLGKPDEEQYDSTKPEYQKSDPNTYNPYNKLCFEESSNYDHVGAGNAQVGNAGRKVSDSENTYNTTSLGNSYLKTSGGKSNNAFSMADETEDTYNHTNVPRHPMGLGSSENDYDAI